MRLTQRKKELLTEFILKNVEKHPGDIVRVAADKFGLSRQTTHKYVRELIADGALETSGEKRNIRYALKTKEDVFELEVTPELDEGIIWSTKMLPLLAGLKENVLEICQYGFTEMLNNVREHSKADKASIGVMRDYLNIELWVKDSGVGIFNKIKHDLGLPDKRYAILELAKGKFTSAPESHTGEGIFFTSRVFDEFYILSSNLFFSARWGEDWLLEGREEIAGTEVFMKIARTSTTVLEKVFDKFTVDKPDDHGFKKTIVPVTLLQYEGEALISRSQAKRLLARFERFKEVVLDFKGVTHIGQPFADEVFRVFRNQHPNVNLQWVNANAHVEKMINHVLSSGAEQPASE
jgi:anti-sigma regulatory factor (Ser/Thr protein kinase)